MRIAKENWKVLTSLFPAGWRQMAWQSGAVERLRGFPSPDVLLRILMLHVARGYSLRETVVRAKLANWADISDVALLKRLRNSEEWLRLLCIELLRENVAYRLEEAIGPTIRVVDGTIVREPSKTGSQWRILYSIRLPRLVCDFFEVTATIGEGSGESLNRLPVGPRDLILADAGYCSVAGIEYVWQHGADVLVRVNPQSFVAYSAYGRRISLLPRLRTLSKVGQFGEWRVVLHGQGSAFAGRVCAVRKSDCAIQQAHRRLQRKASKKQMITRPGTLEFAKYVIVFTTRSSGSTADILRSYRMRWQIELVFKRLKSLAQLGHVPKHEGRSSRAWLYGKLLVTLLAQKLIRIGRDIFSSGYALSAWGTM
jgi:Transposase DDE domain